MKSSGTIYVGATFALLAAYFSYQWWFNPSRALKRQMGEVAAALSVPAGETDVARIARLAQLGRHLADNVRVHTGDAEISSRDAILGAVNAWKPPAGGIDVRFVDTQVFIDSESQARRVHVGGGGDAGSTGRAADCRSSGSGGPSREPGPPVADYERGVEATTATPVIIRPEIVTSSRSRAV